jgi:ABC-type nitrate/sulfonate/bicarbonate transport system ATPase subunit
MKDALIRLSGASRSYGAVHVLSGLNIEIARGEFVAIVGPSGCGKTTLLNLLSGNDKPSVGTVERTGAVRMVYQHDGLFPWKTSAENIRLGLRHVSSAADREKQLGELLRLIGMEGFADHYPHQLSGGMRQRVELARALAGESDILLMDEPFSALDYITRLRMRHELALMLEERPRTVVLVTHDIEEAAQLADRILVLSGRPAGIRRELRVDVPRPRDLTHPTVIEAVHEILAELGLEGPAVRNLPAEEEIAVSASAAST